MESSQEGDLGITSQISVYPTSVQMIHTYPGVYSHFTVFYSNPSHREQIISFEFKGDAGYELSSKSVVINGGEVYSLVISFSSYEIGSFSTVLTARCDNSKSCAVSIQSKVVESPLYFPVADLEEFRFTDENNKYQCQICNRSIYKTLHLILSTTSNAFIASHCGVDLSPMEGVDLEIVFDHTQLGAVEPRFELQCADTGQSLDIPLHIGLIKQTIDIDFGVLSINQLRSKSFSAPVSQLISQVHDPFHIETGDSQEHRTEIYIDNDIAEQCQVLVSFCSSDPGIFDEIVEFSSFFLRLKANCVPPRFTVVPPSKIDDPLVITNISSIRTECILSFREDFIHSTSLTINPGQAKEIALKSDDVYLKWDSDYGTVVDYFDCSIKNALLTSVDQCTLLTGKNVSPVTITNTSDVPKKVRFRIDHPDFSILNDQSVIIQPHSTYSVDINFDPKVNYVTRGDLFIMDEENNVISRVTLEGSPSIVASCSFVPMFGLSNERKTKFVMSVSGRSTINISYPEWIECDDITEPGVRFELSAKDIPRATLLDNIVFSSERTANRVIPILAYRGSSNISYYPPFVTRTANGNYLAEIEVVNLGLRTGFVVFLGKVDTDIHIEPQAAVVNQGSSKVFKFMFPHEPTSIQMCYGDEILRQLDTLLKSESFYSKSFENVETRNEVAAFNDISINYEEFNTIFKMKTNIIDIVLEVSPGISGSSTAFEDHDIRMIKMVDFCTLQANEIITKNAWIENKTPRSIKASISSLFETISVPNEIIIDPNGKEPIPITFQSNVEGIYNQSVEVTIESQLYVIDVIVRVIKLAEQADILDFGPCKIGRLSRAKIRVANKKRTSATFIATTQEPFTLPNPVFELEPRGVGFVPVHFMPLDIGPYHGTVEFSPDNASPFAVEVMALGEV